MKKSVTFLLLALCGIFWSENLYAQNAITYWKDGVPTIIYSPDSIFFWNGDNLIPDISDVDEEGGNVEPTEEEQIIMQMTSDEDEAPDDTYSEEDSVKYDTMAQEILAMFATDDDDFDDESPMQRRKANGTDDEEIQDIILNNGTNIFDNQLIIEQQSWNSGLWGKTCYGGFKTYYGTLMENGKRYLLVIFYYSGGFPNKKTAYIKLGQVNNGKILGKTTIYPGRKYASIRVCIDDFLIDYGCVNFFPLLITEGSNARNYLNPIFVKSKKIVPDGWADLPYGSKFGRINGIPLYCNTSGKKNQGNGYYQCVELCKRYVTKLYPDISRSYNATWGNAWNWPENRSNESGQDKDKYMVFTNGTRQVREGDLIVWRWQYWDSDAQKMKWTGHIGVVIKTTPTYISIAHQNGGSGTTALPIGSTLIKENEYIKDIKPGTTKSPIFATSHPITHFIRRYMSSEERQAYEASLKASTTNLDFGTVNVGESKTLKFKIKNSGYSTLTVSSMTLSKGQAFSVDASSCTIEQGEIKTFTVTFTPTKSGEKKDRLVIRSNADDNPSWTINLSGTGEGGTSVIPTDGLVAYYSFNGNANDESGNGYHATPCNSYQYEDGIVGGCITVEGQGYCTSSGGHVLLPQYDFDSSSGVTLSLWVKVMGLSHYHGENYISFGDDSSNGMMRIHQEPTEIRFVYHGLEISVPYLEEYTGSWEMYTLTCGSDGKLKGYINGVLVGEKDVNYDGQIDTSSAALGRHWWYNGGSTSTRFIGSFDEVRIYNRVLTAQEISTLVKYAETGGNVAP